MVKDAESHAADDQARREVIDARNQADSLAYQVEKTVNENREKLPVGELSKVGGGDRRRARRRRRATTSAAIKTATDDAAAGVARDGGAALQGRAAGRRPPAAAGGAARTCKDGEVVDAEYAETV